MAVTSMCANNPSFVLDFLCLHRHSRQVLHFCRFRIYFRVIRSDSAGGNRGTACGTHR
jgi:hypothetical protein